ncbi:CAF17-like 4Fe-4S cluster assembly/insertion protein YgfZ [Ancylobacter lacus]|uniref:CAF17-like 4Fe-4S cluster assembly/insertion protein YgfZ n=1 Tax=Ancylobacter lacus TaxID=2579970 RepID=UPI001BCCCED5|nr:folate-binding protein [Ancylobacter lacus]MBS7539700.1 folate-binding protein YgfZ [Ancylobacter lacus]
MPIAILESRAVVRVAGADAVHFLDNLLTARTPAPGGARYAALLTPQGKIVADMIVAATEAGFRLDVPRRALADLVKRLTLYRLRAKVEIGELPGVGVAVAWGGAEPVVDAFAYDDPRLPGEPAPLGRRFLLPAAEAVSHGALPEAAWQAHRLALGVPEGGADFLYGDAFPHEADIDQLGGIDFDKGCYVGQEIVSRMQHRGTARSRIVPFAVSGAQPGEGSAITAGAKEIGRVGSGAEGRVLGLVRLDRLADALAAGLAVEAAGATLRPAPLGWARFPIPGTESAA